MAEKGGEGRVRRDKRAFSACVIEVISRVSTIGSLEVGCGSESRCKGDGCESPPDCEVAAILNRRGYMPSRTWIASSY